VAADSTPLLSIRDLTVTFGSFTAVDNISYDLHEGQTLAVVGESGSGKSVTALSIMRLVELGTRGRIENGEILFRQPDGSVVDLVQLDEDEMREIRGNQISMIFQEPLTSLNPVYTVGNQVAEAVMLHQGLDKTAANERALEMFQLRVMIAMALSCDPTILIADEPTTALDVTIQAQILGLMRDLRESTGAAVMIITHDMGVVAEVADDVVVMNQAKVVETGSVFDVFERPQENYTKALLAAVPRLGSMTGLDHPAPFDLVEPT